MATLRRFLQLFPGIAPVDFKPLSGSARSKAEARLTVKPAPTAPEAIVDAFDGGRGTFRADFARVLDEVTRRCAGAEIWQNFYLDLLDAEGVVNDEGEGVGADPVGPDEELLRLLAGVARFPDVRARYAWELGYHTMRWALARPELSLDAFAAKAAAEDFRLAYQNAHDAEAKVNALGDLAGAFILSGDVAGGQLLCDYAASAISAEEAVRQDLHRLRREGAPFVRESYGAGSGTDPD